MHWMVPGCLDVSLLFFVLTDHSNWRVSNLIEKRKNMVYYGSGGRCEGFLKFDHLEGVRWQEQQLI